MASLTITGNPDRAKEIGEDLAQQDLHCTIRTGDDLITIQIADNEKDAVMKVLRSGSQAAQPSNHE